jgi:NTP pyrophosphatase (non-canonical NTP hydrolase)
MKTFEELSALVVQWAEDRGILKNSTPQSQLLKCVSEVGELADATIKNHSDEIADGIGDTIVTLIIVAQMQGLDAAECLALAYDAIKDRKGWLSPSGAFVKEAP